MPKADLVKGTPVAGVNQYIEKAAAPAVSKKDLNGETIASNNTSRAYGAEFPYERLVKRRPSADRVARSDRITDNDILHVPT
jgi:hypothetical protein